MTPPIEEEEDLRQDREREHDAEVRRGAPEIEDCEGECHGSHRRSREGDDAAEEEEPEVPVAQRRQRATQPIHRRLRQ